jgi:lysozyme family protein
VKEISAGVRVKSKILIKRGHSGNVLLIIPNWRTHPVTLHRPRLGSLTPGLDKSKCKSPTPNRTRTEMQPRTRDQKIPDKIFIFSGVNFAIGFKYRLEFVSTPNLQAHSKFYLVEFEVSKEDCNPECVLYVIYFGNYWT